MTFPIDKKLVIAVSSSALFDLSESDKVFTEKGEEEYRVYQEENIDKPFQKGVAFPFVSRLLTLNETFPDAQPIEVVLMSRNSPETGERAFRSIKHYNLSISRACFTSGKPNFRYLPAFNASLFLSANLDDVTEALEKGYAAGRVMPQSHFVDNNKDHELRLAFDFDGVIADDTSERFYKQSKNIETYHQHEEKLANQPLKLGPVGPLLQKISYFQKLEKDRKKIDPKYDRILKIAIVTARNAPAHERVISSLKNWNVDVDEAFFLGGIQKSRVLNIMEPHIFFDDQSIHFDDLDKVPAVHIPCGVANKK